MSQRVGTELNLSPKQVSYHIRYEKTVAKETEIKFMTDGVLLQEIKQDFELSRYSAIVVDEAHERSIFTDVLLGLISMVLRLRRRRFTEKRLTGDRILPPLKLIIMSATLRVSDFAENRRLFPPAICSSLPPVIHVESRQFPVTCHFAKFTHTDYLKAAFRKVVEIHRNAAAGGILVFLTGQREVVTLCNWLSRAFPAPKPHPQSEVAVSASEPQSKRRRRKSSQALTDESATSSNCPTPEQSVVPNLDSLATKINLDNFDIIPTDEETELGSLRRVHPRQSSCSKRTKREHPDASEGTDSDAESVNLDDIDEDEEILKEIRSSRGQTSDTMPVHALPLYSLLSPERQQLVFVPPPDGHRLIVVATNVAETSLTIPNIRFVVDSGKVKAKVYDPATGASSFQIMWVSQASAEQRAGRAGRVAPGHCYRLYSSQVFCSMQPFATPDILTRPIDEVVLMLKQYVVFLHIPCLFQIKSYLGSTPLSRFPLPTTPSPIAVEAAECRLVALGALEELPQSGSSDIIRSITRAGRWMARLPLPARFARMLLFADQHQLMPYAVILVSVLSVPDVFMTTQSTDLVDTDTNTKKLPSQVPNALEQFRANFAQQFVRRKSDLYFGDLAVLLGTVCCLERYAAQLSGMADPEPSILEFCGGRKQVLRDPEAALRLLTERCGVRWNAYKEVRQLRRQLTDILNANIPGLCLKLDPVLPRPTPDQVQQLRQLFLVGSPCHLATKFDVPVEGLPAKDRKRLRYAYRVPGVHGPVFVDPGSPLARENFPFLAFLELHTSAKPFLRNVCAIDPQWIPFLAPQNYRVEGLVLSDNVDPVSTTSSLTLSAKRTANHESEDEFDRESDADESVSKIESTQCQSFVTPPSPHYDADHDQILTGAKLVEYVGCGLSVDAMEKGNYGFQLPTTVTLVPLNGLAASRALGAHEARMWSVRWFARNLLEGRVCEQLIPWFPSRIKKNLRTSLLTVSWGLVRVEVRKLIAALAGHDIDSRRGLLARWSVDPSYLSNELASWLLNDAVAGFHSQWPLIPIKDTQN
ncbi:ATP dependent RNA helicase DHX37 [Fasciola hepatica]|uniref:ATP dependent RNA helicase DHX37 n=1 Tax=Fasciola hepatica TaxID=6192 RepID=A0A4E0RQL0_FASHE|nr:ATP dependent RNA helicase DHX37 [Fasciola hepatica]